MQTAFKETSEKSSPLETQRLPAQLSHTANQSNSLSTDNSAWPQESSVNVGWLEEEWVRDGDGAERWKVERPEVGCGEGGVKGRVRRL